MSVISERPYATLYFLGESVNYCEIVDLPVRYMINQTIIR